MDFDNIFVVLYKCSVSSALQVKINSPRQAGKHKAGDTLSSRHVSSCDVTSAVGIFNIEFWRKLTLQSTLLTSRDLT
jgi:hypothetical protein